MVDETPTVVHIDDLPHYVYCDVPECNERHYLSFNRSADGTWTVGYVDFTTGMACMFINEAATLDEGALRMQYSLERHKYSEIENP